MGPHVASPHGCAPNGAWENAGASPPHIIWPICAEGVKAPALADSWGAMPAKKGLMAAPQAVGDGAHVASMLAGDICGKWTGESTGDPPCTLR